MPKRLYGVLATFSMLALSIVAAGAAQARPCKYQDLASVTGEITDTNFDGDEGTVELQAAETKPVNNEVTSCAVTELIVVELPAGCDKGKRATASGRIHIQPFVLDADEFSCK